MISMNTLLVIALAPLLGAIVAGLFGKQVGRAGAGTDEPDLTHGSPRGPATRRETGAGDHRRTPGRSR